MPKSAKARRISTTAIRSEARGCMRRHSWCYEAQVPVDLSAAKTARMMKETPLSRMRQAPQSARSGARTNVPNFGRNWGSGVSPYIRLSSVRDNTPLRQRDSLHAPDIWTLVAYITQLANVVRSSSLRRMRPDQEHSTQAITEVELDAVDLVGLSPSYEASEQPQTQPSSPVQSDSESSESSTPRLRCSSQQREARWRSARVGRVSERSRSSV
jgi:hypothetical protein